MVAATIEGDKGLSTQTINIVNRPNTYLNTKVLLYAPFEPAFCSSCRSFCDSSRLEIHSESKGGVLPGTTPGALSIAKKLLAATNIPPCGLYLLVHRGGMDAFASAPS